MEFAAFHIALDGPPPLGYGFQTAADPHQLSPTVTEWHQRLHSTQQHVFWLFWFVVWCAPRPSHPSPQNKHESPSPIYTLTYIWKHFMHRERIPTPIACRMWIHTCANHSLHISTSKRTLIHQKLHISAQTGWQPVDMKSPFTRQRIITKSQLNCN